MEQLSLAGFGVVFFLVTLRILPVNRKKDASSPARVIISGPIWGRIFPGHGTVFIRLTGKKMPAGRPRPLSRARFGGVFSRLRLRTFQANREKDGTALAGQLSFHGIGVVFFQVERIVPG